MYQSENVVGTVGRESLTVLLLSSCIFVCFPLLSLCSLLILYYLDDTLFIQILLLAFKGFSNIA